VLCAKLEKFVSLLLAGGRCGCEVVGFEMKNSDAVVSGRKSLKRCRWTGIRLGEFLSLFLEAGLIVGRREFGFEVGWCQFGWIIDVLDVGIY